MNQPESSKGQIILYKKGVEVRLEKETVWLTQKHMSELFNTERSVITKHIRNIFHTKELDRKSVCANFAHTAEDGKVYQTQFYNLDLVISVGYRVNSKRGTQFRIWATSVLRKHLVDGYTINEKRLKAAEHKYLELLYFVTKNHSFVDGNKRIAAALFICFLQRNGILLRKDGSQRIDNNALVALTLMIAASKPSEKEPMVKVILNLLG